MFELRQPFPTPSPSLFVVELVETPVVLERHERDAEVTPTEPFGTPLKVLVYTCV